MAGRVGEWPAGRVAGCVASWPASWPAGRVAGWPGGRVAGWPGGRVAVAVADSKPRRLAFRAFGGSYNFTGIRRASSV